MNKSTKIAKEYDAIIIFETNFQKSIVDHLIKLYLFNKNVLVIDSRNHSINMIVESDIIQLPINLGGLRWIIKSLFTVRKFPLLRTQELIGTHFTGIHCRFFESVIEYKNLSLIDDGIGTPALLRSNSFSTRSFAWFSRYILAHVVMLLM